MSRRTITRTAASAIAAVALGSSVLFGAATAAATPQDDQFTEVVSALGIPVESPEQSVQLGHDVCTLLTQGGAHGPNPVPVVRGVVGRLTNAGMTKGQAANVMRAAVKIYCPEFGSIVGR
jgi:hypothetical protein